MEMKGSILMKKYEVGRLLGQGAFAKVYHGRNLETGQSVAIKVINKDRVLKVDLMRQIKREISIMSKIKHPNIVRLEEVMATKIKIYFVMEYVKGGELFNKVAKGKLSEDVARKYFQELICAVNFCHSRGVYHRDLKPENLLLDENGSVKVTDFGLSALSESKQQDGLLHTICGTPAYVAPEIINRRGYDGAKTDIWSCGVILYVLLAGHLPFHDTNIMQLYRKISRGECKYPSCVPRDVRKLLSRILDPNPGSRISIAEIMENSWFRKGLEGKPAGMEIEDTEKLPIDIYDAINPNQCDNVPETTINTARPTNLNAFDIISFSTGFDLSSFFVSNDQKDEVQFTSAKPFHSIVSKLEEIARCLHLKVMKKNVGSLSLEGPNQSKDGTLSMEVQIFEITSSYYLVKVNKSTGDVMEYQHLLRQDIKPALGDIVWAWQGEKQNY